MAGFPILTAELFTCECEQGREQSKRICEICGGFDKHYPDCKDIQISCLKRDRDAAVARSERAEEALMVIYNVLVEINPNNHDEDDVLTQNNSVIEAIQIASTTLAVHAAATKGDGDE